MSMPLVSMRSTALSKFGPGLGQIAAFVGGIAEGVGLLDLLDERLHAVL